MFKRVIRWVLFRLALYAAAAVGGMLIFLAWATVYRLKRGVAPEVALEFDAS